MKEKTYSSYRENRKLFYDSIGRLLPNKLNLNPVVFSRKYIHQVGMKSILKFKRSYDLLASDLMKKVYVDKVDGFLIFEIC